MDFNTCIYYFRLHHNWPRDIVPLIPLQCISLTQKKSRIRSGRSVGPPSGVFLFDVDGLGSGHGPFNVPGGELEGDPPSEHQ